MIGLYGGQSPGVYGYNWIEEQLNQPDPNQKSSQEQLDALLNENSDEDYWQGYNESLETEYDKMGELASQQSQEWLETQSQLMAQSSGYRSQESAQQYEQDRQMQRDQINSNEQMQQYQINSNERMQQNQINSNEQMQQYQINSNERMQQNQINSNERMQQEEYMHNMNVIKENESIDKRTRNWQAGQAMTAFKDL